MDKIPVYIGLDPREAVAWHVCVQSILDHAKDPGRFEFHAITGERRDGSNDFIYERFTVPYRCNFSGAAIFLDGDMLVRADLADLWELKQPLYNGVQVVKHQYQTKFPVKYLGNKNEDYPRKNWSSVMLWNNAFRPNRKLTPEFVAAQPGSFLHRFSWLDDEQIGSLPPEWNQLAMEYPPDPDAKLIHYTVGTPCFRGYEKQEGGEEWWETYRRACAPVLTSRRSKC